MSSLESPSWSNSSSSTSFKSCKGSTGFSSTFSSYSTGCCFCFDEKSFEKPSLTLEPKALKPFLSESLGEFLGEAFLGWRIYGI